MSLQGPTKQFGGGMTGVVAGRKALVSAQTLAGTLHDGGLAMHNPTPMCGSAKIKLPKFATQPVFL